MQRLVDRLNGLGYKIPVDYKFRRLYPGKHQRANGAWVWRLTWTYGEIGSCDSVTACLQSKYISLDRYSWRSSQEIFAESK